MKTETKTKRKLVFFTDKKNIRFQSMNISGKNKNQDPVKLNLRKIFFHHLQVKKFWKVFLGQCYKKAQDGGSSRQRAHIQRNSCPSYTLIQRNFWPRVTHTFKEILANEFCNQDGELGSVHQVIASLVIIPFIIPASSTSLYYPLLPLR